MLVVYHFLLGSLGPIKHKERLIILTFISNYSSRRIFAGFITLTEITL